MKLGSDDGTKLVQEGAPDGTDDGSCDIDGSDEGTRDG
jgi:hypothetical protein